MIVTSANGSDALARLVKDRNIQVMAVGSATAEAARQHGFTNVMRADGNLESLASLVENELHPSRGPLLQIVGRHVAGDLAAMLNKSGFRISTLVGYHANAARSLPGNAAAALVERNLHGVVLFSPRTARIFSNLVREAELDSCLESLHAFCLSQPVADALGAYMWRARHVTSSPDVESMIVDLRQAATELVA